MLIRPRAIALHTPRRFVATLLLAIAGPTRPAEGSRAMLSHRFRTAFATVCRAVSALGLATALALVTPGWGGPARAAGPPREPADRNAWLQGGDPAARLQIVIKSVNVSNDRDGFWTGAGDILLMASFWRCSGPQPPCSATEDNPATLVAYARKSFDAESGEIEVLNRLMPLAGDVKDGAVASEEAGIAVHAGQDYLFEINAFERDVSGGDFMGGIQRKISQSNNWGIGLHSLEPAGYFADTSLPPTQDDLLCAGCGGIIVGDYLVTYEIRKTALPDLHPRAIKVIDGATGSDDAVCVDVVNAGQQDAASFHLNVYVDNTLPPNGGLEAAGLGPGESRESCIRTILPTSGLHRLRAIVDQQRFVPEMDEYNNAIERGLNRTPLGQTLPDLSPDVATQDAGPDLGGETDPSPAGSSDGPGIARPAGPLRPDVPQPGVIKLPDPDLLVSAIEVVGRAGGSCVAGKNEIFVTIKTSPDGAVGEFAVQVKVDNDLIDTATISGMGSSLERKIPMSPVEMRPGRRTVQAIVDSGNKVTEDNENNNTRTVEVDCRRP